MKYQKHILRAAFLLFLVLAFLLFANIVNHKAFNAIALLLLLSMIICGGVLFSVSYFYSTAPIDTEAGHAASREDEMEVSVNSEIQDKPEKESEAINLISLIPPKTLKLENFADQLLSNLAKEIKLVQAVLFCKAGEGTFSSCGQFAYFKDQKPADFQTGETLPGQAVKNKMLVVLSNIPQDYLTVSSGLGKGVPSYLIFIPLIFKDEVVGLIECASFENIDERYTKALEEWALKVAENIVGFIKK
jgi:hypothetical protein